MARTDERRTRAMIIAINVLVNRENITPSRAEDGDGRKCRRPITCRIETPYLPPSIGLSSPILQDGTVNPIYPHAQDTH